jgi:hypothetical protein
MSPNSGPSAGGTPITINGVNFTGATSVTFGGVAASFTVVSDNQITTTSPPGTGNVSVVITTPEGIATSRFNFVAPMPTVTNLNPNTGPAAGGTSVVITGTNFVGVTAVRFGAIAATSFTVNSPTQITAVAPAVTTPAPSVTGINPTSGPAGTSVTITGTNFLGGAAGPVNVTVTTASGTSAAAAGNQFTYTDTTPTVTGLNPTSGPAGTSVTITGTNFT